MQGRSDVAAASATALRAINASRGRRCRPAPRHGPGPARDGSAMGCGTGRFGRDGPPPSGREAGQSLPAAGRSRVVSRRLDGHMLVEGRKHADGAGRSDAPNFCDWRDQSEEDALRPASTPPDVGRVPVGQAQRALDEPLHAGPARQTENPIRRRGSDDSRLRSRWGGRPGAVEGSPNRRCRGPLAMGSWLRTGSTARADCPTQTVSAN